MPRGLASASALHNGPAFMSRWLPRSSGEIPQISLRDGGGLVFAGVSPLALELQGPRAAPLQRPPSSTNQQSKFRRYPLFFVQRRFLFLRPAVWWSHVFVLASAFYSTCFCQGIACTGTGMVMRRPEVRGHGRLELCKGPGPSGEGPREMAMESLACCAFFTPYNRHCQFCPCFLYSRGPWSHNRWGVAETPLPAKTEGRNTERSFTSMKQGTCLPGAF